MVRKGRREPMFLFAVLLSGTIIMILFGAAQKGHHGCHGTPFIEPQRAFERNGLDKKNFDTRSRPECRGYRIYSSPRVLCPCTPGESTGTDGTEKEIWMQMQYSPGRLIERIHFLPIAPAGAFLINLDAASFDLLFS